MLQDSSKRQINNVHQRLLRFTVLEVVTVLTGVVVTALRFLEAVPFNKVVWYVNLLPKEY